MGNGRDVTAAHEESATRSDVLWGVCLVVASCLLPLSLFGTSVSAAVTISDFWVEAGADSISVYWETASEIGNLGFYLWRSQAQDDDYERLPIDDPEMFYSEDSTIGSSYEFVDTQVTPGILYYYKLQDVPDDGSTGEYFGPESAGIGLATATATPKPTTVIPTNTATPTSLHSDTPVPPSAAYVRFWADPDTVAAGECATVQWQTDRIKAAFFNGEPVSGSGARAFCPCEPVTHFLEVEYQDGSSQTFTVRLEVSGSCEPDTTPATVTPSPSATATHAISSKPSATPQAAQGVDAGLTPTRTASPAASLPPTSEPTLTATSTDAISPLPSSTPRTHADEVLSGEGVISPLVAPRSEGESLDGPVIEGAEPSQGLARWLWLLPLGLLGIGFLVGGLWLWERE
ncbi:MAG: hypothetical protein ACP5HG_13165 [Anaerolineae bacterium]